MIYRSCKLTEPAGAKVRTWRDSKLMSPLKPCLSTHREFFHALPLLTLRCHLGLRWNLKVKEWTVSINTSTPIETRVPGSSAIGGRGNPTTWQTSGLDPAFGDCLLYKVQAVFEPLFGDIDVCAQEYGRCYYSYEDSSLARLCP